MFEKTFRTFFCRNSLPNPTLVVGFNAENWHGLWTTVTTPYASFYLNSQNDCFVPFFIFTASIWRRKIKLVKKLLRNIGGDRICEGTNTQMVYTYILIITQINYQSPKLRFIVIFFCRSQTFTISRASSPLRSLSY